MSCPEDFGAEVDHYGNPTDGSRLINCCYPDCGCDGARLCQAENGANGCAVALNVERGSVGLRKAIARTTGEQA